MGDPSRDLAAERARIEARIAREGLVLHEIVGLLRDEVRFSHWPAADLLALQAALVEESNRDEATKARVLARHLFRRAAPPWSNDAMAATVDPCLAERVRADLAGLVPLGAGLKCLGD